MNPILRVLGTLLLAGLGAGCKQSDGERCQVTSDCKDGLTCVIPAGGSVATGGTCCDPAKPGSCGPTGMADAAVPDAATADDAAAPAPDLTPTPDLAPASDLAPAHDGATPPDLTTPPDRAVTDGIPGDARG